VQTALDRDLPYVVPNYVVPCSTRCSTTPKNNIMLLNLKTQPQPENGWGYRVMNKTDTHSDIIFYIYLNITLSDKNMLFNANTANNSKINLLKVEL